MRSLSPRSLPKGCAPTLPFLPRAGGDIEDLCDDYDDDNGDEIDPRKEPIVICPFHNLDFGLGSGSSSSGMHACTYRLEVRNGGELWMEPPGDLGDDYRVIGIRSVSERASSPSSSRPSET